MAVRLIPGAVGPTRLRGLVLADSPAQPVVAVAPATAGVGVFVSAVLVDPALGAALAPIHVWSFELQGLAAATSYRVTASVGGMTTAPVPFSTIDPAAQSLKIVAASCFYDGFHTGPHYDAVLRGPFCNGAAMKLLIGDNVYLDIHPRQSSMSDGARETAALYRQYFWSGAGYPDALAVLPSLATWDDHEIWNNAPEEQLWLSRTRGQLRRPYLQAAEAGVRAFQVPLNPPPIAGLGSFVVNDLPLVSLFVFDARMQRTLQGANGRLAPDAVIDALVAWADTLTRPGVLVVGQPLMSDTGSFSDYLPADFQQQFRRIWQAIHDAPWEILILTGDVHHSRASSWLFRDARRCLEVVTSPAAHIPTIASVIFGTYGTQDRSDVEMPESVKAGSLELTLEHYYFGTGAPNSIATLEFAYGGAGTVDVGCTFIDLCRKTVPASEKVKRGWFQSDIAPRLPTCTASHLFTLHRR